MLRVTVDYAKGSYNTKTIYINVIDIVIYPYYDKNTNSWASIKLKPKGMKPYYEYIYKAPIGIKIEEYKE